MSRYRGSGNLEASGDDPRGQFSVLKLLKNLPPRGVRQCSEDPADVGHIYQFSYFAKYVKTYTGLEPKEGQRQLCGAFRRGLLISIQEIWRREQDSNLRSFRSMVFKTTALNRSAIPPHREAFQSFNHLRVRRPCQILRNAGRLCLPCDYGLFRARERRCIQPRPRVSSRNSSSQSCMVRTPRSFIWRCGRNSFSNRSLSRSLSSRPLVARNLTSSLSFGEFRATLDNTMSWTSNTLSRSFLKSLGVISINRLV